MKSSQSHLSPISPISKTPQSEYKKPMVPIFSIQSPLKETLNSPYNFPLSVNSKRYSSTLMTPLTKTLYAFGESLDSPHKNYIDFKQKIINNQRNLKLDFENNDLMSKSKILKKENNSEELKLKIKPQFFNNFRRKESLTENNFKNISNFNDDTILEEKTNMKEPSTSEKKMNKTPEFKKEESI